MKPKKNKEVDSEDFKSRTVYVLSGLVLVIAFILCLVEYKKIDLAGASIESSLTALEDEEVVEINPNYEVYTSSIKVKVCFICRQIHKTHEQVQNILSILYF